MNEDDLQVFIAKNQKNALDFIKIYGNFWQRLFAKVLYFFIYSESNFCVGFREGFKKFSRRGKCLKN
jgi:hypothetical protein